MLAKVIAVLDVIGVIVVAIVIAQMVCVLPVWKVVDVAAPGAILWVVSRLLLRLLWGHELGHPLLVDAPDHPVEVVHTA